MSSTAHTSPAHRFSGLETRLLATEAKESLSASLGERSKEGRDRGECSKPVERDGRRVAEQPMRLRLRGLRPNRGPRGPPGGRADPVGCNVGAAAPRTAVQLDGRAILSEPRARPRRGKHPARRGNRRTLLPQNCRQPVGFANDLELRVFYFPLTALATLESRGRRRLRSARH